MAKRSVITIDETKCVGCGDCVNACVGGALALVDGKAKLMREDYCDGLGVCVGECPTGALKVEMREAREYDGTREPDDSTEHGLPPRPRACPGAMSRRLSGSAAGRGPVGVAASALTHWPIQLHLVPPNAPQFQHADVLVAASCAAFACGGFHLGLLAGRSLIIACPKLDDPTGYLEKLTDLFREAAPRSVTIARMEVPCCRGLNRLVLDARAAAGADTPVREVVIGLEGQIQSERMLEAVCA